MQNFEGMDEGTKLDSTSHRKPVQTVQQGRNVSVLRLPKDESSTLVLQVLQTGKVFLGDAIKQRAAIIQSGED